MIRLALLLFAAPAFAAWPPVAVTDPVPGATHCALIVDGVQRPDVAVQPDSSCRINVEWLAVSVRRVQIVAVRTDGVMREQTAPVPPYAESCVLVDKPSTSGFRLGWAKALTCTKSAGCRAHC